MMMWQDNCVTSQHPPWRGRRALRGQECGLTEDPGKALISRPQGKGGEEAARSEAEREGTGERAAWPSGGRGSEMPLSLTPEQGLEALLGLPVAPDLGPFILRAQLECVYRCLCSGPGPLFPQPA